MKTAETRTRGILKTCGLIVMLALFCFAGEASADKKAKAKSKFLEGVELFGEDRYPEALAAFEASFELRPKITVLYNIGMCQKALFRYVDSVATFKKFLETGKGKIKRVQKEAAEAALEEMASLVGHLRILDAPEGAEIFINGDMVGVAPIDSLTLDPGQYAVRVEKETFKSLRTDVTIASGAEITVRAKLGEKAAHIKVDCKDVEDSFVYVDDKAIGACPFNGELSPGKITLIVRAPGMQDFETSITAERGSTTAVTVNFNPKKPTGLYPEESDRPVSGLMIGGIATLVVGAGAGALGGYFTYRGSQDHDKLTVAANTGNGSDYETFEKDLNRDKAIMVGSFIAAGALIATGTVLLVVDTKRKKKGRVAVAPFVQGLQVTF